MRAAKPRGKRAKQVYTCMPYLTTHVCRRTHAPHIPQRNKDGSPYESQAHVVGVKGILPGGSLASQRRGQLVLDESDSLSDSD
jgi:hypothetical protein